MEADPVCEVAYVDEVAVAASRQALPERNELLNISDALKALANPNRLALLLGLRERELCVCDCSQLIGLSIPATSQHLKQLRQLGAITYRQSGKMAYYRIADASWVELCDLVQSGLQKVGDQ